MWLNFSVSDEDLLELYGIFGVTLQEALDIIDREQITIFRRASDQREYIEISEHQHNIFKLLPNINYCTCSTFCEKVINSNDLYTCKHVLAAKLTLLTGTAKVETSSDDVFTFSLQMIKPISIDE